MNLQRLRAELGTLDGEILKLVARRQELAKAVGRAKLESGLQTRDYAQEKEVLGRARAMAVELGISPDVAEDLVLLLIRSSLVVQERDRVASHGSGSGQRALVIGGSGKMGSWFGRFLASQSFTVEVADPAGPLSGFAHHADWRAAALDHDIVVVASPLGVANQILHEL